MNEEEKAKQKKQKDYIESQTKGFEKVVGDTKAKVQDILAIIKQNKDHNSEQIAKFE